MESLQIDMRCRNKSRACIAACVCLLVPMAVEAQELEFPISPSPVGSGARAAGMADAFVAIADDATAASWNPAGLVQLERPEFSIVGSFNGIREEFDATGHPEFSSTHRDGNLDLNFMSFVYPLPSLPSGRNSTISLSYQQKFDFSRQFRTNFSTSFPVGGGLLADQLQTTRFSQDGGLSTITTAFAVELTHRLSVGVAVNLWRDTFLGRSGWDQTTVVDAETSIGGGAPTLSTSRLREVYSSFSAENYVVGLLWNFRPNWNFAFRYDSAFTGNVDYERDSSDFGRRNENRKIDFPATLSVGLAYRRNDRLTVSADIGRTDWQNFLVRTEDGSEFSLIDGSDPNDPADRSSFDPTYTVRLGAEYVFIDDKPDKDMDYLWSVRGGVFYDQEPASGRRRESGGSSGEPDDFYGFAAGLGLLMHDRINLDLAYQLRFGENVNSDFFRGVNGFEEDVFQHRFLFSMVIYF